MPASLERRLSALESANPPADGKTFVIRFVSPGHLDAEIHSLHDDDGTLWTRQNGETEQMLIDRASKQAKRNPWGFARLLTPCDCKLS